MPRSPRAGRLPLTLLPALALFWPTPETGRAGGDRSVAKAAAVRHKVLATDASKRRIAIFDRDGRIVWEAETRAIHDLQYLPNGNVLFQQTWTRLVEMTPDKQVVWSYDSAVQNGNQGQRIEVHAFRRLDDGSTMIAESGRRRIIEVDRDGKLLVEVPLQVDKPHPHRDTRLVRKLQNGNYLVAHEGDGVVREYTARGEVVWDYPVPLFGHQPKGGHGPESFGNQVFSAIRLPNGNTLIGTGNGHSVLEVTKQKEIVWHLQQDELPDIRLAWVTTVEVLPNGNLLIGNCHAGEGQPQMIEITWDKKVVWTFTDFTNLGNSVSNSTLVDAWEDVYSYQAKVAPILRRSCYKCHGTKGKEPKGHLWLPARRNLLMGGGSGAVVDLADPERSPILRYIRHEDPEHEMPPKHKLPDTEIAVLADWVRRGVPMPVVEDEWTYTRPSPLTAEARAHWSFQPVRDPAPPGVTDAAWPRNGIDRFVLARLERADLRPNGEADRISFIRRATYDLTGLPPTLPEVRAFLADDSAAAHEKLIDRLLASRRYGEQWGRHWLDLVRFAETNGYERDSRKPEAWRYRQYVIDALNANKPYDRFVLEQLAGDELPDRDAESITATGYLRLGLWDDEPADPEQALFDGLDDIVRTSSEVFLGLTVGCARCHEHKLDPIPQEDYYSTLAFFRNVRPYSRNRAHILTDVSTGAERAAAEAENRRRQAKRAELGERIAALRNRFATGYATELGGSFESSDLTEVTYEFFRSQWEKLPDFDALKPETTGRIPSNLFDIGFATREDSFGFVFRGRLKVPADGRYTFFLDADDGARLSIDGDEVILYDGIHGLGNEQRRRIELTKGEHAVRVDYFQAHGGRGLRLHWSARGMPRRPLSAGGDPTREFERLLRKEGPRILGDQGWQELTRLEGEVKAQRDVDPARYVMSVTEDGRSTPDTHVLIRGNPHSPGRKVEPAFLQILGGARPRITPCAGSSGRRLAFARWLVSADHPLTARVMVNRIWQFHFGRGIVPSSSDFGMTGRQPTHPDLLDWLARRFVASGWDMKLLHKTIMMSATYRLSSAPNASAAARDPANDLMWRYDVRRLRAEELRDSILAAAGTLRLDLFGGPSVFPTIPDAVLKGQSANKWQLNPPPEHDTRRSVYTFVMRSLLDPFVESFDAATTDTSCAVRFQTTQPTQALTLLNSGFANAAARNLSQRLLREVGSDPRKQVARALHLVTCREPTDGQIAAGVEFLRGFPAPETADQPLEQFCLLALNLNEFVFVD